MTWSQKRQTSYLLVFIAFIVIFGFLILAPRFQKEPTCTDNVQNGGESGVDCGGLCARACLSQVDEISVLWSRAFRVVDERYNAVAYLVNHNKNTAVEEISYRFRFADKDNLYISKREGTTTVPPGGNFAVFEPGIDVGKSIPVYVTFEFTQVPQWVTVSEEKINQLKVIVSNIVLTNEDTKPVLSATIKNNSFFTIPDMDTVAILYDASGNAVSASRTFFDKLGKEEIRDVNFTWPEPLPSGIVVKEIIPMYNIFSVKLK